MNQHIRQTDVSSNDNIVKMPRQTNAGVFLQGRGLTKAYVGAAGRENILLGVDIDLNAGEVLAISAPSGAGKSTLLKLLGGLEAPDQGTVTIAGVALNFRDQRQLADLRARSIGFIFQRFNLIPFLNTRDNVALPLKLRGMQRGERQRLTSAALALVGLAHKHAALPATLSGGEQQRVAIARALAGAPSLLLCDEPTGSLNEEAGQHIFDLLTTFAYEHGRAVVLVTHNERLAQQASRRLYLRDGRLHSDAREFA